jgi:hypothetical protein
VAGVLPEPPNTRWRGGPRRCFPAVRESRVLVKLDPMNKYTVGFLLVLVKIFDKKLIATCLELF